MRLRPLLLSAFVGLTLSSGNAWACSSCGCTLNTDLGSQGIVTGSGWRLYLRYDLVDQDQLRSGDAAVTPPPLPTSQEIEQETRSGYTTLGLGYGINRRWSLDLQLPWIDRHHSTYAAGDTVLSSSDSDSLSDVRLLARYAGFANDMSTGFTFGLKLPTGSHDTTFAAGPQAGQRLDRSLQPGSGTTDLLLGVYHFDDFGPQSGWFANALYQHALTESDGFKPGDTVNLNLGLRYYWGDILTPQLQINAQVRGHDTDPDPTGHLSSGGRVLYISPGFTFMVNDSWHGHVFVQLPVYQQVYGLQLAPTRILSIGMSYAFR
ncbi:MAG TPA: hypothetical protein VLG68_10455 [Gammaproteobacteria bacterium]|nr:hypothetical protein [Gammaproteobacteria bacterium]